MNYNNALLFAAGAVCGAAIAWYISKKKYEERIREEIDSVKAVFRYPKYEGPEDSDEAAVLREMEEKKDRLSSDTAEYTEHVSKCGYFDYSCKSDISEMRRETYRPPYVISPHEFGELDDYDRITLRFYSDQILADDNDEKIEDVESTVGIESLNHFGEYEDDSVFVRNERLGVDYEILLDQRKYSDVLESKPYLKED